MDYRDTIDIMKQVLRSNLKMLNNIENSNKLPDDESKVIVYLVAKNLYDMSKTIVDNTGAVA
jgi:hypothetical protein|tara:strand:- start:2985 stop:3170 length:186 start_codon:yes stop_codon:yes gene_type:complete